MEEADIRKIDGLTNSQKNLLLVKINSSKPALNKPPNYTKSL